MDPRLTAIGLVGLAAMLLAGVVALLGIEARNARMRARMREATNQTKATGRSIAPTVRVVGALTALGDALRGATVMSDAEVNEIERTLLAAGIQGRRVASLFLGAKVVLLIAGPFLGYGVAHLLEMSTIGQVVCTTMALVVGMLVPNWVVAALRGPYLKALRKGLPDALDLMVVCSDAGLGLETAVDRVSQEIAASNRPLSLEFAIFANELRILPDRRQALTNLGDRTTLEGFRRMASTVAQTLQYGTPLSQALRTLAAEMRQERMIALEERAAKLPAIMVVPMILLILPCLFIVLLGPSVVQFLNTTGSGH